MTLPIALQLYSVKNDAADDLPGVLNQVAAWGYDGVEFAGLHGHAPDQLQRQLHDLGLRCAGAHVPVHLLDDDQIDQTIEDYLALGSPYLIVPYLPEERRDSPESTLETAQWFAQLAERLAPHDLRTGFHAHHIDVRPFDDGRSPWDILAANTPESFILQYDTANGMDGGADPVAPIRDHPGRAVTLHLKEYSREHGHGHSVIGEGDVPWAEVFDAATDVGGTRWYIVEQEGHPTLAPMDAARRCLDNLRGMG